MSRRRMEALLWILALAVALLGAQRWRRAEPAGTAAPDLLAASPPAPRRVPAARLEAAAAAVTGGNPFRLDRIPAPVGFNQPGGMMPGIPDYTPPPPPRPQLAVTGIVGPPWQAVLEGVPGREGAGVVVRRGDVLGELRVRDVTATTVVVSAPDTTWRLTVRRPWQ
jgi:hypothetical protein